MLQAFVITLREGLEAFLIVAISLAYLRKSGRKELVPAVHWGIALAILISIGAAVLLQRAANQALWEGVLAIAAAISVASLTVHMWRTARRIKSEIEGHLQGSTMKQGAAAFMGVFAFTLLMITREGMETALLMGTLLFQVQSVSVIAGAAAGTLLGGVCRVAVVAIRPPREPRAVLPGHRGLPAGLRRPVADLRLPRADRGEYLPVQRAAALGHRALRTGRQYGQYLSYLLVMLPLAWLAVSSVMPRRTAPRRCTRCVTSR